MEIKFLLSILFGLNIFPSFKKVDPNFLIKTLFGIEIKGGRKDPIPFYSFPHSLNPFFKLLILLKLIFIPNFFRKVFYLYILLKPPFSISNLNLLFLSKKELKTSKVFIIL
jgi:hypothetical protein